jgi:hypothetical protein
MKTNMRQDVPPNTFFLSFSDMTLSKSPWPTFLTPDRLDTVKFESPLPAPALPEVHFLKYLKKVRGERFKKKCFKA